MRIAIAVCDTACVRLLSLPRLVVVGTPKRSDVRLLLNNQGFLLTSTKVIFDRL